MTSNQISEKLTSLENQGKKDTPEYKALYQKGIRTRQQEVKKWTTNWKKNSKKGGK